MEFKDRLCELKNRSASRNIYTYTDFLSPSEQAEVGEEFALYDGGHEFAERRKVCFGDPTEFGYEPDFGIILLKIISFGTKFNDPITHRDVLGATLNLGIERSKIGDIFTLKDSAYMFVDEKVAPLIEEELDRVGRVTVEVTRADSLPCELQPKIEEIRVAVASVRADSILCAAYKLSRERGSELFAKAKVCVNGKTFPDGSKKLKANDVVTVRGYGKFIFYKECGESRKGKIYVKLGVYA